MNNEMNVVCSCKIKYYLRSCKMYLSKKYASLLPYHVDNVRLMREHFCVKKFLHFVFSV